MGLRNRVAWLLKQVKVHNVSFVHYGWDSACGRVVEETWYTHKLICRICGKSSIYHGGMAYHLRDTHNIRLNDQDIWQLRKMSGDHKEKFNANSLG